MTTIKKINVKVHTTVLTLGLNHNSLIVQDEYMNAKDYFKSICPTYLSSQYIGDKRFSITYEVSNG